MNRYGPRQRSQSDKLIDALTFAITAPDRVVNVMTAESIAARYGVKDVEKVRDALARRPA